MRSRVGFPEKSAPIAVLPLRTPSRHGNIQRRFRRIIGFRRANRYFSKGSHAPGRCLKTRWSWKSFIPLRTPAKGMRPAKTLQKVHDKLELEVAGARRKSKTTGTAASREYPIKRGSRWRAHLRWDSFGEKPSLKAVISRIGWWSTNANVLILGSSPAQARNYRTRKSTGKAPQRSFPGQGPTCDHSQGTLRERIFRTREGCFYRRRQRPNGSLRSSGWRHAIPG